MGVGQDPSAPSDRRVGAGPLVGASVHDSGRLGVMISTGMGFTRASWRAYWIQNGVMKPSSLPGGGMETRLLDQGSGWA